MLGRFRHETKILGRLQHPGIAQIFEAGTFDLGDGEQPFFAMEFVAGRQILDFVREKSLSTRERLALMAEVCDAVHHAHQQGVIHRDLKSDNVLVSSEGSPKVLDFGVGRLTDADAHAATALSRRLMMARRIPSRSNSSKGNSSPGTNRKSMSR